ncbi:hypothetical protein PISMIDRAFT_684698 [Pisolithus microcarpus 441]|uniref:Profilin n=1 Tax=Pisolithus microcarpus 441 TaxID=765257 RepID=A0A0C9XZI6_9AGAM|nr:hypothetical protein PISMIDRAFT_684698 [Pisolithus microcarpus 441]
MSWQDFIDKGLLEGGIVSEAAIFGIEGGIWAQSAGCNVFPKTSNARSSTDSTTHHYAKSESEIDNTDARCRVWT